LAAIPSVGSTIPFFFVAAAYRSFWTVLKLFAVELAVRLDELNGKNGAEGFFPLTFGARCCSLQVILLSLTPKRVEKSAPSCDPPSFSLILARKEDSPLRGLRLLVALVLFLRRVSLLRQDAFQQSSRLFLRPLPLFSITSSF